MYMYDVIYINYMYVYVTVHAVLIDTFPGFYATQQDWPKNGRRGPLFSTSRADQRHRTWLNEWMKTDEQTTAVALRCKILNSAVAQPKVLFCSDLFCVISLTLPALYAVGASPRASVHLYWPRKVDADGQMN